MATELDTRLTTSARDFGLLALRIGVGAPMVQAGLKKFIDFDTTSAFMEMAAGVRPPWQRSWFPSQRPSAALA